MDKYIEAELDLAGLLYPESRLTFDENGLVWKRNKRDTPYPNFLGFVPRWAQYNAAAFELMVEHDCYPSPGVANTVTIRDFNTDVVLAIVDRDDHPSKEAAVRYAIVMAVIAKLEAK